MYKFCLALIQPHVAPYIVAALTLVETTTQQANSAKLKFLYYLYILLLIYSGLSIAFTYGQQPYFAPGESWHYANTNYILLGKIAEAATSSTIASEIRSRILEPLGLNNTFFAKEEEIPGGLVRSFAY